VIFPTEERVLRSNSNASSNNFLKTFIWIWIFC
jgi:hypothetical protein